MSKEKQIEEMAFDLLIFSGIDDQSYTAEKLYEKGYHKQRDGEWRSELIRRCDWKGKEQQYFQPNSCSICHNAVATRTPFCPKCGAKMKGGAE